MHCEVTRPQPPEDDSENDGTEHHQQQRNIKKEHSGKAGRCDAALDRSAQSSFGYSMEGDYHQSDDGGLKIRIEGTAHFAFDRNSKKSSSVDIVPSNDESMIQLHN